MFNVDEFTDALLLLVRSVEFQLGAIAFYGLVKGSKNRPFIKASRNYELVIISR